MMDETDIREEEKWWFYQVANTTVRHLQRRHITAEFFSTRKEALERVMDLIPEKAKVGWGDSITLHQTGIVRELKRRKSNHILDPFERNTDGSLVLKGKKRLSLMRKVMSADVFLSSVNAISMDGKLVSIDATGNRVASLIFGPKRVIIIAGVNKIERNLEEALKRVKDKAAPINAKRHFLKHNDQRFADLPCTKTGTCADCNHPERICNYTVIIEGEREPANVSGYVPRMHVILVGEKLGI
jgi:hypothetical protein